MIYTTIKEARADGFRERKRWEYGGEETTVKGQVLFRNPKRAMSMTEWKRNGFEVKDDAVPLTWRWLRNVHVEYDVYTEHDVRPIPPRQAPTEEEKRLRRERRAETVRRNRERREKEEADRRAALRVMEEERRRKSELKAAWLAEFESKYASSDLALKDACEALYHLNHYAKCLDRCALRDRIYGAKNSLIDHLYRSGKCVEAVRHVQYFPSKECWGCFGSGVDNWGDGCERCGGTGNYREDHSVSYVAFRFDVNGTRYSWHQPEHLLAFTPKVEGDASPMPPRENKPVPLADEDLGKALLLLEWFVVRVLREKAA